MFLYGMNIMADGMQKSAGGKMKKLLGYLNKKQASGSIGRSFNYSNNTEQWQPLQLWWLVLLTQDL